MAFDINEWQLDVQLISVTRALKGDIRVPVILDRWPRFAFTRNYSDFMFGIFLPPINLQLACQQQKSLVSEV